MNQIDQHYAYVATSRERLHHAMSQCKIARINYEQADIETATECNNIYIHCKEMYNLALRCHIRVQAYDYSSLETSRKFQF
jgi:hypothetical protein